MSVWTSIDALAAFVYEGDHLETHGPTAHAFTFRQPFAPPDAGTSGDITAATDDRWNCPTG